MKPPERFPPDDPREWLNRARGNLAKAKVPVPGGYLEDLCFDAQQAGEAVLIARHVDFPYTHDLSHLLTVLETHGESIPDAIRQAEELTRYAARTRYPGFEEPVSETEYQDAISIAEAVIRWAEEQL